MRNLKRLITGIILLVGLAGAAWAVQQQYKSMARLMREAGFKFRTARWIAHTVRKENGKTVKYTTRVWISDEKYRMEARDPKQGKQMIYIDTGRGKYIYTPEDEKAVKLTPVLETLYAGFLNSDVIARHAQRRKQTKLLGEAELDGKVCDVYAYQSLLDMGDTLVASDVKEWIWRERQFPIRTISKTPESKMKIGPTTVAVPALETETSIKNLVMDKSIPESLFMLPQGIKIESPDAE